MKREIQYWISDNKEILLLAAFIVAVVGGGLFVSFQPQCTTFADGETLCYQIEWGGKRYWRK